jgi:NAD+ kinase
MTRVGFILKPDKSEAGVLLDALVPWLHQRGHIAVVTTEDQVAPDGAEIVPEEAFATSPSAIDLCVVLGGDGTMLRASRLVADQGVPVLGINLGQLGFLTGFAPHEAQDALALALAGKLPTSARMRLAVTFRRLGAEPVVRTALNDAVIHQGAMARLVELHAHIDGDFVSAYRADGLIVATPTGSTAYNMAAGGPILVPGQAAMTLTPICAHSLTNRPLVVPQSGNLSITLGGDSKTAVLTVDGQWSRDISAGDRIEITATARPLRVFLSDKDYFDILRQKLHWGAGSEPARRA